jgi:hypothetical protein
MSLHPRRRKTVPGAHTGIALFMAAMLLSGLTGFALRSAHAAETPALSAGCAALNAPGYDTTGTSNFAGTGTFLAGERVVVVAVPATGVPTTFDFYVDWNVAKSAAVPGTVNWDVPASGPFTLFWSVDTGEAAWTVSCGTPGQDPTPTPTTEPTATPTATPVPSSCVPRGNENAEQASQNGKEHSCLAKDNTFNVKSEKKPGKSK